MEWTRGCTIGQGSSATVSVATLRSSGDIVAVKSADFYRSETLQREQKILSTLTTPYIVSYQGFDVTTENNGKLLYNLFMEFSPEGTLTDEIRRQGGRLSEELIMHFTHHILLGLEYLHSRGLTHCDIKGRNILIDGVAKIADFGSARWDGEEAEGIRGTPPYMAPEVARGQEQGSPADVWALGCTIIEMATGHPPWVFCGDPVQLLYRIGFCGELPELPSFLSVKATDFLTKCLRREAEERWTASQLLNHPFLTESTPIEDSKLFNFSPTSILDPRLWSETDQRSLVGTESSSDSAVSRIGRLRCFVAAEWSWDQKWVTVREDVGPEYLAAFMDAADRSSVGSNMGGLEGGAAGAGGQKCYQFGGDVGQNLCLMPNYSLY